MATYSALQIASYFLTLANAGENDVSNLKLQKLCYYAQGLLTSMRGERLFHEDVLAWDHGPVVEKLYHEFKRFGSQPITPANDFDIEQINESDRNALDDIYEFYGQFSPWRLREMTHEEKPWKDAYKKNDRIITIESLIEFFSPQLDENCKRDSYGETQTN